MKTKSVKLLFFVKRFTDNVTSQSEKNGFAVNTHYEIVIRNERKIHGIIPAN